MPDGGWFEWIVATFSEHPYLWIALLFILCGMGLPLPEEIALVAAGYLCFKGHADLNWMMVTCGAAILAGDMIPFALGRHYGASFLRVRPMRLLVTTERLARFDRWFRRRGDLVIFFSRFIAGIRVVSFFAAGTMKTTWRRFVILDALGIVVLVPVLVYLGWRFGEYIERTITSILAAERWILIVLVAAGSIAGTVYWLRRRRRERQLVGGPTETFVEPSSPVREEVADEDELDVRVETGGELDVEGEPADDAQAPPAAECDEPAQNDTEQS